MTVIVTLTNSAGAPYAGDTVMVITLTGEGAYTIDAELTAEGGTASPDDFLAEALTVSGILVAGMPQVFLFDVLPLFDTVVEGPETFFFVAELGGLATFADGTTSLILPLVIEDGPVIGGTDGPDTLNGDENANTFWAGGGNDTITGNGGDDRVFGEGGDDTAFGGAGNDELWGDSFSGAFGDDTLFGGAGADQLYGGQGVDLLYGGDGDDFLSTGEAPGNYAGVYGGAGQDRVQVSNAAVASFVLTAENSIEVLDGSFAFSGFTFSSSLSGTGAGDLFDVRTIERYVNFDGYRLGEGNDTFLGAIAADTVFGGAGDDRLEGNAGDDLVFGGAGADALFGGDGNDTLYAAERVFIDGVPPADLSVDTLYGGQGDDILYAEQIWFPSSDNGPIPVSEVAHAYFGGAGIDELRVYHSQTFNRLILDDAASVERVMLVLSNNDNQVTDAAFGLSGTAGDDIIDLSGVERAAIAAVLMQAGDDLFVGTQRGDDVFGGAGHDTLFGLDGSDTLTGGAGDDDLLGGNGWDVLRGDAGADQINGDGGHDTIYGGADDDHLSGDAGNDALYGDAGNDTVMAGQGADTLYGGAGADVLAGGNGYDALYGGAGQDRLNGDRGHDTLWGGDGDDALFAGQGIDTLYGGAGADRLDGARGVNHLFGGDGADTLFSAGIDNTLEGGAGADVFVFAGGTAVITDFDLAVDELQIPRDFSDGAPGALSVSDLAAIAQVSGGDLVFDFASAAVTLRLTGVTDLDAVLDALVLI